MCGKVYDGLEEGLERGTYLEGVGEGVVNKMKWRVEKSRDAESGKSSYNIFGFVRLDPAFAFTTLEYRTTKVPVSSLTSTIVPLTTVLPKSLRRVLVEFRLLVVDGFSNIRRLRVEAYIPPSECYSIYSGSLIAPNISYANIRLLSLSPSKHFALLTSTMPSDTSGFDLVDN